MEVLGKQLGGAVDSSVIDFRNEVVMELEKCVKEPFAMNPTSEARLFGQQERSYSEEDMLQSFLAGIKCESKYGKNFEQFIKQFKNK